MNLIHELAAAYLIALPFLLMCVLSRVATAVVLFRRMDKAALGGLLNVEKARYRQNLVISIGTWTLVQAVLIVFSRNLGVNTVYSFLLALAAPHLRDFLDKRHLMLIPQDAL